MATQKVQLGVEVSDNGSAAKTQKNIKDLHSEILATQKAAQNINVGGTQGSRAVAARAQPQGSQTMTGQEYGSARGTAGMTGASARDFANQAQGLGGLVRLYATFAANIFAVSAAFTALSSAMDTTNMVRGLDQLGAATGRNLGGLSKRLVEITDGAISFRDSMEAVAKTTSSGMSSRDIERLAMVAKNASLALGVAMPDAISRLSRGITKLEPELLDELGIMTKIEPAVQAYSREVGKAASQLTDFERRQAFANAVLAEGEAKFGELATAAVNPYDRLLASLKNVSQQALEVVNNVLGPVVSLLASSPGALAGALGVIATLLVRQALPALTEFKAGLASAADTAANIAKTKAEDARAARNRIDKQIMQEVEARAEKEVAAVDAAERKIQQLRQAGYAKNSMAAKLLATDLADIRNEDLAKQEAIAKRLETRAANIAATPGADPKAVENAKRAAEANRDVVTSITAAKQAQEDYITVEKKLISQQETAAKGFSIYGLTIQAAKNAEDAATKKAIISNAAYNASLIGLGGAYRLLSAEIAKSGLTLTAWELAVLKARAATGILIGAIGTIGSAINRALGAIGLIASVIGILDSVFSKASKELGIFSSSVEKVEDAVANASRVIEFLDKKGGYASATIEGTSALANAMTELANSADEAVKSNIRAQAAMSGFEKFKDKIFSAFGGGTEKTLAKALGADVVAALDILSKAGLDEKAREKFKEILGVESLDLNSVTEAILKLSNAARGNLVKALAESNTEINNSSSRLQSFKTATDASTKAYQDFIVSTANTNPLFKLGGTLESLGKTMSDVIAGGAAEMEAAMISLANSPEKGMLFGPQFTQQLLAIRQEFLSQAAAVTAYTNRLKELDKQIEENKKGPTFSLSNLLNVRQSGSNFALARQRQAERGAELERSRERITEVITTLPTNKIKEARDIFVDGMQNAFKEGSRLIDVGLGQSAEKAAQIIAKAQLGGLTGERRAVEETRIAQKDIQIQLRAIDTNINLILVNERLTAAIELANARTALQEAKAEGKPQEVIARLQTALTAQEAFAKILGTTGAPNLRGDAAARAGVTDAEAAAIVNQRVLRTRTQIAPQQAARTEQEAASEATRVSGERSRRQGQLEDFQRQQGYETAINQQIQTRAGLLQSISPLLTEQSALQQKSFEIEALATKQLLERKTIDVAIANARPGEERKLQEGYKVLILQKQEEERRNLEIQARQKLLQIELDQLAKRAEVERSNSELQKTLALNSLEIRSQELALYSSINGISREFVINQQAALDKERALVDASTAMQAAQDTVNQKRVEAELRIQALKASDPSMSGVTLAAIAAENAELDRQQTIANNTIAGLSAQLNARIAITEKTREANLEQERYNQLIKDSVMFADSLKSAFGEVGEALGKVATTFAEVAKNTAERAKAEKIMQEQIDRTTDPKEKARLLENQAKQQKINAREELSDNIKIVASAKNVFKEKTAAYKILSTTEKAMHAYKMATFVIERAQELKGLATKLFASTGKIGATIKEAAVSAKSAVIKAWEAIPPPFNYAAAALVAAAVGALLSKMGGGSVDSGGSGGFVLGAEQRQETQGTGMAYDAQGNRFETGGGVFGDATEKLDSINKSIGVLKDNSIDGLFYDNRMLNALERIAKSITGAAEAIYSTPGIRTGLNFGSLPGSSESGGFLSSLSSIPIIGSVLGSVFGGGTSSVSSISDSGIQLRGTLQDIADAVGSSVMQYKEILTQFTKKGGVFSSSRSWTTLTREVNNVSASILESFSEIFKESKALFISVADIAGISASEVDRVFRETSSQLDISLLGLKGEDVVKELNASISAQLDVVSKQLFASFDQFRKFGEGYTDTVLRVVDTNNKVTVALEAMGIAAGNISGNFRVSETIIGDMALSLENFTEQAKFFIDNFLTETERLAITRAGVGERLSRLSLPVTLTRDEFKTLVQSLDLTTKAGRDLYQSLQDIAPDFIKVTEKLADLEKESQNLAIELLKAQGETEKANKAIRDLATEGMIPAELAAYDYNESLRKQIDLAKEADAVLKQRTSLEQRFLQVTQNTAELRKRELAAVAEVNRELQLQIWSYEDFTQQLNTAKTALTAATQAIETAQGTITQLQTTATDNYVAATQQVATAQQNVANLAIEAAKRMRDFGKTIREFISQQLNPAATGTGNVFARTVELALSGNTQAIQDITGVAQQAIDSARQTAQSASEFAQARAALLAKVSEVAQFAETEAARTAIPLDDDPLIAANRALELAIVEQTKAQQVANAIGASLVKTPEDLIAKYTVANQDLATAIANKLQSEEAQARAQAALDAIVANTGKLISTSTPSNELQFARGGVFSNKVITGATRFQFGEMGEAGPEAIMPLFRTRDGSLGVVAQPVSQSSLTDAMLEQNLELVAEVRALREEVNLLRFEARATASSTTKTTRLLERVTRDGESLIITDSATL